MSALAHVALVAGLLLASPIGPPVDTPEFIEIPVEVVALPPQGEAAATPAEPATADVVPELHLPAPPEVADPDIRPESAPAAIAEPDLPPPPEVDAPAVAAEPPPALETAEVATPPRHRIRSSPRRRCAMNPNRGRFRRHRSGRRACRVRKRGRIGSRSLKPPIGAKPIGANRAAGGRARGAPRGSGSSPQRRRAATRCGGSHARGRAGGAAAPDGCGEPGRAGGSAPRRGQAPSGPATRRPPRRLSPPRAGNYRGQVIAHLAHFKRYPEGARARQAEGVPVVAFTLDGSGRVTGAGLSRSSGHADIDAEALAMVRRAVPFPAPPAGAGRSFSASIGFRLR